MPYSSEAEIDESDKLISYAALFRGSLSVVRKATLRALDLGLGFKTGPVEDGPHWIFLLDDESTKSSFFDLDWGTAEEQAEGRKGVVLTMMIEQFVRGIVLIPGMSAHYTTMQTVGREEIPK